MAEAIDCLGHRDSALFWVTSIISVILAVIGVVGNGTVIRLAHQKQNIGPMMCLNRAIKSLAITDLLIGLIGVPLIITYYWWGKNG